MSQIGQILDELYDVVLDRQANPKEGSYTNYLLGKGLDKICKKIGEESAEVIIAAKNRQPAELTYEVADLLYHRGVRLVELEVRFDEIEKELRQRR